MDKHYAQHIALARCQYSGNAKGIINGIGIVTCVYVNPTLDRFYLIDYRIYDPETDGKSKLTYVKEMLSLLVYHKHLLFSTVLMDSLYATKDLMLLTDCSQSYRLCYAGLGATQAITGPLGQLVLSQFHQMIDP